MGEDESIYAFGVKYRRKGTTGRPRHRWEDNIKIDLREIGWGGEWIGWFWLRIRDGGVFL
jgi:hypothetical protein